MAVLLNEGADVIGLASQAGYRCFTDAEEFKHYVESEILAEEAELDGIEVASGLVAG